jgi:hypothetical protein
LFDQELFTEIHGVAGGIDPNPAAPRQKVCRWCATEIFLWGIRDWWIRERRKGRVSAAILDKPDCASGKSCRNQKDPGEALLFSVCDLTLTLNLMQITRESVCSYRSSLDGVILNNPFLFTVNHMVDTVTEEAAAPIVGPSYTSASTSGMMLNHHEPQGIAAN